MKFFMLSHWPPWKILLNFFFFQKTEIAAFKTASAQRIKGCKAEIERINSLIPYEHMTLEDFAHAHPESAVDPLNKPTFWPHNPEEQLGYKPDDATKQASH